MGKEQKTRKGNLWISNLKHISLLFLTIHGTLSGWVPQRTEITIGSKRGEAQAPRRLLLLQQLPGGTDALCWRLCPHCSLCEDNLLLRKVAQQPCYHIMQAGPKALQIIKTWLCDELVLFPFQCGALSWVERGGWEVMSGCNPFLSSISHGEGSVSGSNLGA